MHTFQSPFFVETHLKVTTLCCFSQDNPAFLSVRASRRTGCKRTVPGLFMLQIWTYWTVMSGDPCWKGNINSSQSLRPLMSWKSPCRPSGKSCHKNTSTRRWRTSLSTWLPAWLPVVVICSNPVRLQVCILISSPTNWLFSEPSTDYGEDNARNAEKRKLSWLIKRHNSVILRHISTKLGRKLYTLLFNDYVKLRAKICTKCWETDTHG